MDVKSIEDAEILQPVALKEPELKHHRINKSIKDEEILNLYLLHEYAAHLIYNRYIEMATQYKHVYINLIYIEATNFMNLFAQSDFEKRLNVQ